MSRALSSHFHKVSRMSKKYLSQNIHISEKLRGKNDVLVQASLRQLQVEKYRLIQQIREVEYYLYCSTSDY